MTKFSRKKNIDLEISFPTGKKGVQYYQNQGAEKRSNTEIRSQKVPLVVSYPNEADRKIIYNTNKKIKEPMSIPSNSIPKYNKSVPLTEPPNSPAPEVRKDRPENSVPIIAPNNPCGTQFPHIKGNNGISCGKRTLQIVEKMGTYQIPQVKAPNSPSIKRDQGEKTHRKTYFSLRKAIKRLNRSPKKFTREITLLSKSNQNIKVICVIDTASDVCIIDAVLLKRLGIVANPAKSIIIKDLNKSRISAAHSVINVEFEGEEGLCDFYEYGDLESVVGAPILVGRDLINGIIEEKGSFILASEEKGNLGNKYETIILEKKSFPLTRENKVKECSRCHKVLPLSHFYKREGNRGKGNKPESFLSTCKKCRFFIFSPLQKT